MLSGVDARNPLCINRMWGTRFEFGAARPVGIRLGQERPGLLVVAQTEVKAF